MRRSELYVAIAVKLLASGASPPLPPSHLTFLGHLAAHIVDVRLLHRTAALMCS